MTLSRDLEVMAGLAQSTRDMISDRKRDGLCPKVLEQMLKDMKKFIKAYTPRPDSISYYDTEFFVKTISNIFHNSNLLTADELQHYCNCADTTTTREMKKKFPGGLSLQIISENYNLANEMELRAAISGMGNIRLYSLEISARDLNFATDDWKKQAIYSGSIAFSSGFPQPPVSGAYANYIFYFTTQEDLAIATLMF